MISLMSIAEMTMSLLSSCSWRRKARALGAGLLTAFVLFAGTALAAEQRSFPTPQAAVEALSAALQAPGYDALLEIFGHKHRELIQPADTAIADVNKERGAQIIKEYWVLREDSQEHETLLLGYDAWPFPIPLVREAGQWRFATELGADEILNRRIGANELNAIHVLRAYVDAQREYAGKDRMGDGVLQYAQKLGSSPGKQDGLYWVADTAKGDDASPFGPLVAEAGAYLKGHQAGDGYRGYRFKVITRQAASAPGGAYSYVINGRMIAGFALLAYPAEYGETGIMSFIVSHSGKVYQKDLGPKTATIAGGMKAYDPGPGWKLVTD
jgi:DUF2950 family protein